MTEIQQIILVAAGIACAIGSILVYRSMSKKNDELDKRGEDLRAIRLELDYAKVLSNMRKQAKADGDELAEQHYWVEGVKQLGIITAMQNAYDEKWGK